MRGRRRRSGAVQAERGFSIVELAIVITVMLIIISITVPGYRRIVEMAKEDTLRQDLHTMRKAIDQFTADKEKAPSSLEELVEKKYISAIPVDPMTGTADSWEVILEEEAPLGKSGDRGIEDVKSGSTEIGSNGEPFRDW